MDSKVDIVLPSSVKGISIPTTPEGKKIEKKCEEIVKQVIDASDKGSKSKPKVTLSIDSNLKYGLKVTDCTPEERKKIEKMFQKK